MTLKVKLKPCPYCGRMCMGCGAEGPEDNSRQDADALWNRRAPEPGTSVIRWIRYDGTPETLPNINRDILVYWANKLHTRTVYTKVRELFDVDDVWAYLPNPTEYM